MAALVPAIAEAAASLAVAVVVSSKAPLLLLDDDFRVVAASDSFCDAFGVDPATARGGSVFDLGSGAWDTPKLRSTLRAVVSGGGEIDAYETDIKGALGVRRLVLSARRIHYGEGEPP